MESNSRMEMVSSTEELQTSTKIDDNNAIAIPNDEASEWREKEENQAKDDKMEVEDDTKVADGQDDKEEGEEGEPQETFREPIMDGRNYMICSLCMGYYRDAQTITECLHTFCKSCITKYLRDHFDCPQCGTNLGTFPIEKLKFDRQIQTLMNKILTDVVLKDLDLERKYYEQKGIRVEITVPVEIQQSIKRPVQEEPEEPVAKKIKKSELKRFYSDEVSFELILDESEVNGPLKKLDKPFIRTSAKVTVKHLKKYIQKKLNLENIKDVEITYKGEVLGNEHSLEYIMKTRGADLRSKNPIFKYKTRREELLF